MTSINVAIESIKEGLEFTRKNFLPFFKKMLVVDLFALLVLIVGGFFILTIPSAFGSGEIFIKLSLILLVAITIGALASVAYNIIHQWPATVSIKENFKNNLEPMTFYLLIVGALQSLISSIIGRQLGGLLASTIINFLFQFAVFELIISRVGVINSLKKSFDIATKNFLPTIVLNIVGGLIFFFITALFVLPLIIASEIGNLDNFIIIVFVIILLPIYLALLQTIMLPMGYVSWKKVRGDEANQKARSKSSK